MFEKIKRGGVVLASALLTVGALGFAQPALATEDAKAATDLDNAHLTKVIDGPAEVDASDDKYVFHFAGGGTVAKNDEGKLISGGVEQNTMAKGSTASNAATLKVGDTVPAISDLTFKGVELTNANAKTSGQVTQAVVQASMKHVLGLDNTANAKPYSGAPDRSKVTFPHAGIYTYQVTETTVNQGSASTGNYIVKSEAEYLMRVNVINGENGTEVSSVTVERIKNDEGVDPTDGKGGKVDSTKPEAEDSKITKEYDTELSETQTAGDPRGRDVNGFTFANEYVRGGQLVIQKRVLGDYGDKTKKFPVTLHIVDSAAPAGSCITYEVSSTAEDTTLASNENNTSIVHALDGVSGNTSSCVEFQGNGKELVISANLADGEKITVTGLYGTKQAADSEHSAEYRNQLTTGLKATTQYYVDEGATANYTPYAYIYQKANMVSPNETGYSDSAAATLQTADDDAAKTGNSASITGTKNTDFVIKNWDNKDTVTDTVVGNDGAYVYLVNVFDDSSVNPTGIFIDNLPYILMIGIPLAVFVGMFVNKRRNSVDLAA